MVTKNDVILYVITCQCEHSHNQSDVSSGDDRSVTSGASHIALLPRREDADGEDCKVEERQTNDGTHLHVAPVVITRCTFPTNIK